MNFSELHAVIVHYKSVKALKKCLESLTLAGVDNVIVIDNSGEVNNVIPSLEESVRLFIPEGNIGFASAVNMGAGLVSSTYLLVLNPDVIIDRESLRKLMDEMEKNGEAWVVGPILQDERGGISSSGFRLPTPWTFLTDGLISKPGFRRPFRKLESNDESFQVGWILGACMLIRTERFNELGGMDERFFLYAEDKDFCARVIDNGGRVLVVPMASAIHTGEVSEISPWYKLLMFIESQILYIKKHFTGGERIIACLGLFFTSVRISFLQLFTRRGR